MIKSWIDDIHDIQCPLIVEFGGDTFKYSHFFCKWYEIKDDTEVVLDNYAKLYDFFYSVYKTTSAAYFIHFLRSYATITHLGLMILEGYEFDSTILKFHKNLTETSGNFSIKFNDASAVKCVGSTIYWKEAHHTYFS